MWAFGALELAVRDVFEAVMWHVAPVYKVTSVSRIFDAPTNPLEKSPELICCRMGPGVPKIRVPDELTIFEHVASAGIEDGIGNGEEISREMTP